LQNNSTVVSLPSLSHYPITSTSKTISTHTIKRTYLTQIILQLHIQRTHPRPLQQMVLARQVQPLEPTPQHHQSRPLHSKAPTTATHTTTQRSSADTNQQQTTCKQTSQSNCPRLHHPTTPIPQHIQPPVRKPSHTHPTLNRHAAPYSTNASTTSTINGSKAIPPSPTSPIPNVR
jgi:hypothetical protein